MLTSASAVPAETAAAAVVIVAALISETNDSSWIAWLSILRSDPFGSSSADTRLSATAMTPNAAVVRNIFWRGATGGRGLIVHGNDRGSSRNDVGA